MKRLKSFIPVLILLFIVASISPLYAKSDISISSTTAQAASDDVYLNQINKSAASVNKKLPFSKGVNFSIWFNENLPGEVRPLYFTEQDFIDVKNMGVEAIRLPIKFHNMTGDAPTYTLDSRFLHLLDLAVNWAEKYGLYLILDNHSWSATEPTKPNIGDILIPVWQQVATRYKNKSNRLIYEILNEPHGIDSALWDTIQTKAIEAIREIDANRTLVVTGTLFGSIDGMKNMAEYDYENLIYSFHFYDPFVFTHQGQNWTEPYLTTLKGVPFPGDAHAMPEVPDDLKGTWIEEEFQRYPEYATVEFLEQKLDQAVEFANQRNVPIFCGEFGVFIPNSQQADRVRWYKIVNQLLTIRDIARTSWDYYGGFGLFKETSQGIAEYDLNTEVVSALGLTPLPQKTRKPIDASFYAYEGKPNTKMIDFHKWECSLEYYRENGTQHAMQWDDIQQYGCISMNFKQQVAWQNLFNRGYEIILKVKSDKDAKFQVRFMDDDENGEIPWRLVYDVDLKASADFQTITIPFSELREWGAWLNDAQKYVPPEDKFSWDKVASLQITAEQSELLNTTILFDTIKISGNDPDPAPTVNKKAIIISVIIAGVAALIFVCFIIIKSKKSAKKEKTK